MGGGVKPVQITGAQQPGRGPTAQLCCIIFCPSSSCHYLPTVQINPFTPRPSHSATDSQSFRCSVNIFSLSSHAGEAQKKKISPEPKPALGGPASSLYDIPASICVLPFPGLSVCVHSVHFSTFIVSPSVIVYTPSPYLFTMLPVQLSCCPSAALLRTFLTQ
jgi:hypothetical protein